MTVQQPDSKDRSERGYVLTKRGLIAARRLPGPRESRPRLSQIRKHRVLTRLDHRHDLDPFVDEDDGTYRELWFICQGLILRA